MSLSDDLLKMSSDVMSLEKQRNNLAGEVQHLKNLIFKHGLREGLIPIPIKCCSRDYDEDGNCDVHSAPGVLREKK